MQGVPYWRLSGFYLCYFSALGSFLPYWGLYLQSKGYAPTQIGELMAILVGTKIIAPNIWGWIADHTGKSIRIIQFASFFSAGVFLFVLFGTGYWWMAGVMLVFSFFWNAALPQFEAMTLSHLKSDPHRYSLIRIWGSIGFIASVTLVGTGLDYFDIVDLPQVIVLFLVAIWLITLVIPDQNENHHSDPNISVGAILKQPEVLAFFAVFMLVQMAHAPYYVFFSIYLEDSGYSRTVTGQLWALGVLAEVILFVVMHRILYHFKLRSILLVSVFLGVVRWALIAWAVDQIVILILAQLLHAATFGSSHVVAIHFVHRYFNARNQGKGQALYSSTSFGLGGMLGSLYCGHYWASQGPIFVYTSSAVISLLAFLIAFQWIDKKADKPSFAYGGQGE